MRLNYVISNSTAISIHDVHYACNNFFDKFKTSPDTVRMSYYDQIQFLSTIPTKVQPLERGKDYGLFIAVPGGMVELLILEQENEVTIHGSGPMIIVESTRVDREFERHILNKDI